MKQPRFQVASVVAATGARLMAGTPDLVLEGVSTDSRHVWPGALFVALRGPRYDGHDFVTSAVAAGARAVLVEPGTLSDYPPGCAVLEVDNTRTALARWAVAHRRQFGLPVVAVAGSNGKTSTKNLLAAILAQRGAVLASPQSFNNDLGVPLTLLQLEPHHWAAVLEVGTNHPGELRPLLEWIQPAYGIFTGVGREHLEFFGDLAGVAAEEGTLAELLPPEGVLVLNGDDSWAPAIAGRTSARVVFAGMDGAADWRVVQVVVDWAGTRFRVEGPDPALVGGYQMRLLGRHQARNALLAMLMARALGATRSDIYAGLSACKAAPHRMEVHDFDGVRILDDSYNANPDSLRAALETFCALPCRGRRIAVLGEMAELGSYSEQAHREAGRWAAELGVAQLFVVGPSAGWIAAGARAAGLMRVMEFAQLEPLLEALRQWARPGDTLLLKGSRRAGLDRLLAWWRKETSRRG
ncbi:MAG: UDP-N-acetylmuramoyl-tripeptide--D-alanyl-D-alanine ligase [Verrucomicrobiota bacterium]|nr:UDP-N-acetylmuramoyl-tripeptide--D-alanyl-D-alanine ligase [Limisphaera sp.]MDW8381698.1 UDP-N-acetylmuramoyl-tripeptide--D-alanyl-D-alanine ligase [Verrucomicrobiota bacterium]